MTLLQDLGDLIRSRDDCIGTDGLRKNNIDLVGSAAPNQACLGGAQGNNDLIILTAKRTAAFCDQHADHTKWLPNDTDCFTNNTIMMSKKFIGSIRSQYSNRSTTQNLLLG